jgi:hypothetical protein
MLPLMLHDEFKHSFHGFLCHCSSNKQLGNTFDHSIDKNQLLFVHCRSNTWRVIISIEGTKQRQQQSPSKRGYQAELNHDRTTDRNDDQLGHRDDNHLSHHSWVQRRSSKLWHIDRSESLLYTLIMLRILTNIVNISPLQLGQLFRFTAKTIKGRYATRSAVAVARPDQCIRTVSTLPSKTRDMLGKRDLLLTWCRIQLEYLDKQVEVIIIVTSVLEWTMRFGWSISLDKRWKDS